MKMNSWRCGSVLPALTMSILAVITVSTPQRCAAQLLQGTIDGNVVDPSQASVANAAITVVNPATGFTRAATTNTQGGFTLATLPPGTYNLTVKAQGFQTYTQQGIVVNANAIARADVTLTVGQVNQSMTVSAEAAALQTDRADVRADLGTQSLNNLPEPLGRNYQMIVAVVVPGISTPSSGQSFGANPSRSVGYSVNGASSVTNDVKIDGTSSGNFNAPDKPMYSPALEAIENVNVVTNSFDAEQGLAGGAATTVTTKSGTNAIHGSLFEYHTDQHLQAYPYAGNRTVAKPKYINNQFGGTVGGPIKKDKLFFFASYQGTYVPVENPVYAEVPTAAMKTGNMSASAIAVYDPATGAVNGTGRTPFPGNIIPTNRIDPGIAALLAFAPWPNPNLPGTGSSGLARDYLSAGNSEETQNQWDSKLTWTPTNKLSMFARFGLDHFTWFNPQQFGALGGPGMSPSNTAVGTGGGFIYSGTLSGAYIFGPNLIVDAYFGYSRDNANSSQEQLNQNLGWTLMGIPGLQSSETREGGLPALEIDDFGGTGSNIPEATLGPANNFQPQSFRELEREWAGNVTWIKGTHNIRAGVDYVQQHQTEDFEENTACTYCTGSGGFQFSLGPTNLNGGPSGNDYNIFGAFLLGLPSNAGKVTLIPPNYFEFTNIFGGYVRDQWQVSHKLTVTYGVRFMDYPFPTRNNRGMEYLTPQATTMIICGVGGNPKNCGITKDTHRFEPRVGIAYRLTNSTVIRTGYGLSTDPTNIGGVLGDRQNYPDIVTSTLAAPNSYSWATTLRQGLPPVVAPNYSSGSVPIGPTTAAWTVDNNNYVRGYVESWNFTVEQRFKTWTASAGYVASRSIDPIIVLNENWGSVGTGSAGQVLNILAGRTAITDGIGTEGNSKYDSLQARITHRFTQNFLFTGTYTFAKALGYSTQVAIPYDFGLNYGNLASIATHTLGWTLAADTPFGKNQRWMRTGMGGKVLGGWQLEAVSTVRTGTPFTVTAANTSLNATGSTQFADCIAPPQELREIYTWYNKSTFALPSSGRFGTCGTDNVWGPGLIDLDGGVSRNFALTERFQLKFRVEMFNTANTPHHANPTSSISSSTFMQALGIANTGRDGIDQRTTQFSLRLGW